MLLLSGTMFSIMSAPFSFTEIQKIPDFPLQKPSFFTTLDDCRLAYYSFIPPVPKAIVIFYPGAGLYGNRIHQWIGKQLQKHAIGAYIIDIRGHGLSGGDRGDAPTIQSVWDDISTVIERVQAQHPEVPIYLAGHSSGAGLLLNYGVWPQHKFVNGLILLAPYLGPNSGTLKEHEDPDLQFTKKIRNWVYLIAGLTGGQLCAHIPAVYFNYPQFVFNDPKIVRYYTYTMSAATTPYYPQNIFHP
jgi:pimeloyl-ACP methyl ester carboxylesterase